MLREKAKRQTPSFLSFFSSSSSRFTKRNTEKESGTSAAITGEIIIPKRCFHSRPSITVSLKDNFKINSCHDKTGEQIQDATVASCCLQPAYICAGDKLQFDLPYSESYYPAWYTLCIRVEDSERNLICVEHQVTLVIGEGAQSLQPERIQIPLINVQTFAAVEDDEDYDEDAIRRIRIQGGGSRWMDRHDFINCTTGIIKQ